MLKSLTLTKYGKFTDTTFEFAPVTIVSGLNEAGKTTFFDALFESLCSPPGTTKEGRALKRRYGDDRQVSVKFEGEKTTFEVSEFLNLYAIRAGNINIEISDQSAWMERVKSNLFTGGIDPNPIKENLDRLASNIGTLAHNKELKNLKEEQDRAKRNLDTLKERRDSIFKEEKALLQLKKTSKQMEDELHKKEKELQKLKADLDLENTIRMRKNMDRLSEFIDEGEHIDRELSSLTIFQNDQTEELDSIHRKITVIEGDKRLADAKIQTFQTAIMKLKNDKQKLIEQQDRTKAIAEMATRMNERINAFLSNLPACTKTSWNKALLFAGFIALTAAIAAISLIEGDVIRVVIAAAGLLLCVIFGFMARKPKVVIDEQKQRLFFQKLIDEWKKCSLEDNGAQAETLEEFREQLLSKRNMYRELHEKMTETEQEINATAAKVEHERQEIEKLEKELQNLKIDQQQWLETRGVANRDEYVRNVSKYRDLIQRQRKSQERLASIRNDHQCKTSQELRRLCDRKLREFDESGIPNQGKSEAEIVALKNGFDTKGHEIDVLSKQLRQLNESIREEGGVIKGSLGEIPDQIIKAEARIQEIVRLTENNVLDREAAALASEIFGAVAQDSQTAMKELSKELSREFAEIVDSSRQVTVAQLDSNSILITDAGGVERPLEELSSGTRNSFIFAARLALAKQAADKKGILILDEPFVTFDNKRLGKALTMVNKFQKENDWQVIILTKDEALVNALHASFPKERVKEHTLDV